MRFNQKFLVAAADPWRRRSPVLGCDGGGGEEENWQRFRRLVIICLQRRILYDARFMKIF